MSLPAENETSSPGKEIRVSFYSGYMGEETPRAVFIEGQEHPIEEILERKRIQDTSSGETFDLFVCRISGNIVKIKIDPSGQGRIL